MNNQLNVKLTKTQIENTIAALEDRQETLTRSSGPGWDSVSGEYYENRNVLTQLHLALKVASLHN